jgi:hypothetical protein
VRNSRDALRPFLPHLNEVKRRMVPGPWPQVLDPGGSRPPRRWWYSMGQPRFPDATTLLITANAGGSNGHRVKLWKNCD